MHYVHQPLLVTIDHATAKLPAGVGSEWMGISFEERLSGSQAPALYAVSIAVVFLCLAALYESWSIPVTVLLVVPLFFVVVLGGLHIKPTPHEVKGGKFVEEGPT